MNSTGIKRDNNMVLRYLNIYFFVLMLFVTTLTSCKKSEPSGFQKEEFYKFFGGVYENTAVDMFSNNGNYYIAGNYTKDDKETTGILIVKTDDYGNRIWEKKIEKQNNLTVSDIIPLTKGEGIALVGTYETDDSLYFNDFYIQVINFEGESVFDKVYNETLNETGKCIGQYPEGTFIMVGEYSEPESADVYKFAMSVGEYGQLMDKSGPKDGRPPQEVHSIVYDHSNDFFIVVGKFPGFVGTSATAGLFAVNRYASFTNHFTYNISGVFTDIVIEGDNTYVCGEKFSSGGSQKRNRFVASINPYLDEVLWYTESSLSSKDRKASGIAVLSPSELVVVGSEESDLGSYDISVTKTNMAGNITSEDLYGDSNSEQGVSVLSENGNIIILATSNRDENSLLTLFKP